MRAIAMVVAAAAFLSPLQAAEEDEFWRDVIIRLSGALPVQNERLNDTLEIYLGRRDGDWGGGDAAGKWRTYVMGFSGLYDPRDVTGRDRKLYSWMDAEGKIVQVKEEGESVHLEVEMMIHPDHWVAGGPAKYAIDLKRDGRKLNGSFTGVFERNRESDLKQGTAGALGKFDAKGTAAGTTREGMWPSPVQGHTALAREEHPRLMFRKSDLPALKKRMETPDGKAILAKLTGLLADEDKMGTWHGWGYGLMYQLTAEKKWSDLAKKFAEGVMAGNIKSPRYGWFTRDGGYMRAAPSAAAVAAAYDMCYESWEPAFREGVARKIQGRICPNMVFQHKSDESDSQFTPRSNHYMLWNGGAGTCILAIKGDSGTDETIIRQADRVFRQRLKRGLDVGFGDHGFFYEGTFCGRFPTNGALTAYIQALRIAEGKDYVANCSEAQWLCTKWIYEVLRSNTKITCLQRGMYNNIAWIRPEGDFSQGFGIVPEAHKAAVLWFYGKVIEPEGIRDYDTGGVKQAAYAFVNWPIGLKPQDPSAVLGHALVDREAGFYVLRSGWQGEGDIVLSMHGSASILGMGLNAKYPGGIPVTANVTDVTAGKDKTAVICAVEPNVGTYCLAGDFSGASGAPALFALLTPVAGARTGGNRAEPTADEPNILHTSVTLAGKNVLITTVQRGPAPKVQVVGEGAQQTAVIGKRVVRVEENRIVFGQTP